jgi:hypothetical protein
VGGGFRIYYNEKTIDYYTGQFNGCFSTKWYRFGDACGGLGYVEYGYTLAPGCKNFSWDFSPSGILPGDLKDGSQAVTDPAKPPPVTKAPSSAPSTAPSGSPSLAPSDPHTEAPSAAPIAAPTGAPVVALTPPPTPGPTDSPTLAPTNAPTTKAPVPDTTDPPIPIASPTTEPVTTAPTSNDTNYTQVGSGAAPDGCTNFTFSATIAEDPLVISYRLEKVGDNDTMWAVQRPFGAGNDAPGTSIVNSTCLDLAGCYTFTIRNRAYDATQGPQHGSFTLRLGGVILAQFHGMTDGCYRKKWYQFGEDCEFQTGTEPVGARLCGE